MRAVVLAAGLLMLASSPAMAADPKQGEVPPGESAHRPILVRSGQSVEIVGRFAHPDGIRTINLFVVAGELSSCQSLIVPCRQQGLKTTYTCNFDSDEPQHGAVACVHSDKFTDQLVTYWSEARTGAGQTLQAPAITFAATNQREGIWAMLPIYWHSGIDGSGGGAKVSMGFLRSQDYGDNEGYYDFLDNMGTLVEGAFHGSNDYANLYSRSLAEAIDLWLLPRRVHLSEHCQFDFPYPSQVAASLMWVGAVLHKGLFRDCANVQVGGRVSVYGGSPDSPFILVHETGHCPFGLDDEYACGGLHEPYGSCRNLFDTLLKCSFGGRPCDPVACGDGPPMLWRLQSPPEIMKDPVNNANWQNKARLCVANGLGVSPERADLKEAPPVIEKAAAKGQTEPTGLFPTALQDARAVTFSLSRAAWQGRRGCPQRKEYTLTDFQVPASFRPISASGAGERITLYGGTTPLASVSGQAVMVEEGRGKLMPPEVVHTILLLGHQAHDHPALTSLFLNREDCAITLDGSHLRGLY